MEKSVHGRVKCKDKRKKIEERILKDGKEIAINGGGETAEGGAEGVKGKKKRAGKAPSRWKLR